MLSIYQRTCNFKDFKINKSLKRFQKKRRGENFEKQNLMNIVLMLEFQLKNMSYAKINSESK